MAAAAVTTTLQGSSGNSSSTVSQQYSVLESAAKRQPKQSAPQACLASVLLLRCHWACAWLLLCEGIWAACQQAGMVQHLLGVGVCRSYKVVLVLRVE